jgi:hypothetical protein
MAIALFTLVFAQAALATHEVPQSADSIHVSLVPVFRQCGTGANPTNGQHSPPLGVPSCLPAGPNSSLVRIGPDSTAFADLTALPGDLQFQATLTDVQNASGQDFNPNSGADLFLATRMRMSDHANCPSAGCPELFDAPGTGFDHDNFEDKGPPINCTPRGDPNVSPGSDCNVSTTINAIFGASVFPSGTATVIQVFRLRVLDLHAHGGASFQQGIYIP